jgi:hypothetical protein
VLRQSFDNFKDRKAPQLLHARVCPWAQGCSTLSTDAPLR